MAQQGCHALVREAAVQPDVVARHTRCREPPLELRTNAASVEVEDAPGAMRRIVIRARDEGCNKEATAGYTVAVGAARLTRAARCRGRSENQPPGRVVEAEPVPPELFPVVPAPELPVDPGFMLPPVDPAPLRFVPPLERPRLEPVC